MGFKIKNSLTGEFEKLPILTLKGEKGETGGVEEYNKVDYMGNKYETLKQANDANVEYAVKTAIGEFNYLDYDGQYITATDTIEGRSKSAILKGKTLVNVIDYSKIPLLNGYGQPYTYENGVITNPNETDYKPWEELPSLSNMIKSNTKYLITMINECDITIRFQMRFNANIKGIDISLVSKQKQSIILDSSSGETLLFKLQSASGSEINAKIRLQIIEYQDGMENWDIPYFEGMQSVKMPVLTTTGKNLLSKESLRGYHQDVKEIDGWLIADNGDFGGNIVGKALIEKGKTYTLSTRIKTFDGGRAHYCFSHHGKNDFNYLNGNTPFNGVVRFTATETTYIDVWLLRHGVNGSVHYTDVQLEEGSVATSYESYKTNILTVNEDVELRGIGDVKDTLDLTTGELTERIGYADINSFVAPPSYRALSDNQGYMAVIGLENKKQHTNLVANLVKVSPFNNADFGMYNNPANIVVFRKNCSLDELKSIINQIQIVYELETPVVKTVDLSDNHVYSYKGTTHYDCSSAEGSLVPTLSVKVPTDVQATIAQQRETIQTLNSENERLNQIQEALKASMLDSQVQLMNLSWNTDFEVFTLRESIAPKDFLLDSRTGSNIDKFSQAKFIIENDCPDLEKLNSQIEYYFSKDVFSQEQFEELTDLISIVKGENGCEY